MKWLSNNYIKFLNRRLYCLLFFVLAAISHLHAQQQVSNIGLFEEKAGKKDLKNIYTALQSGAFRSYPSANFNLGPTKNRYWLHFSVTTEKPLHLIALLSNPFIYDAQLYTINNGAITFLARVGADKPFGNRQVKNRLLSFPITTAPGKNDYLLMVDRRQEVLRFSVDIIQAGQFTQQAAHDYLFFGSIGGILLFIAAFAMLLGVLLRDGLYAWYAAYILLMFMFIAADNGFGYELFWPDWPFVQKNVRAWLGPAAFAVQVCFMYQFLGKSLLMPFFRHMVKVHLILSAMLILLTLVRIQAYPPAVLFYQLLSFIYYLGGVAMILTQCCLLALKKNEAARLYLLSILPVGLLITFVMLSRFGIITINIETARLYAVAIVLEITILAFGLARRYRFLKKHKDHLEYQLLLQQKENFSNVLIAQDNERKRIAEDLHDDLGGTLSAIKGLLTSANTPTMLQQAEKMLDETSEKLRYIAHDLMPAGFNETSLVDAIEETVLKANTRRQTKISFLTHGTPLQLAKGIELNMLRMVIELVNNIIKHSGASEATVQLIYHEQSIELIVEDNGSGLPDPTSVQNGIGLNNVRSRAAFIGGTVFIDSNNHGTTIICTIPA